MFKVLMSCLNVSQYSYKFWIINGSSMQIMVLFKVAVSCYAAVLSDAKLKGFNNMSMSAKLSLMSLSRVIASVGIAAVMEPNAQPSFRTDAVGFFDHWTMATWIVTVSFTSKSLITLYLLKSLDSIQKNVGEVLLSILQNFIFLQFF